MRIRFWSRNVKGRDHSEDLDVDVEIVLERQLRNRVGRCVLDAQDRDR